MNEQAISIILAHITQAVYTLLKLSSECIAYEGDIRRQGDTVLIRRFALCCDKVLRIPQPVFSDRILTDSIYLKQECQTIAEQIIKLIKKEHKGKIKYFAFRAIEIRGNILEYERMLYCIYGIKTVYQQEGYRKIMLKQRSRRRPNV